MLSAMVIVAGRILRVRFSNLSFRLGAFIDIGRLGQTGFDQLADFGHVGAAL